MEAPRTQLAGFFGHWSTCPAHDPWGSSFHHSEIPNLSSSVNVSSWGWSWKIKPSEIPNLYGWLIVVKYLHPLFPTSWICWLPLLIPQWNQINKGCPTCHCHPPYLDQPTCPRTQGIPLATRLLDFGSWSDECRASQGARALARSESNHLGVHTCMSSKWWMLRSP